MTLSIPLLSIMTVNKKVKYQCHAECCDLVISLNVVMLNVVASSIGSHTGLFAAATFAIVTNYSLGAYLTRWSICCPLGASVMKPFTVVSYDFS